jgi:deoxyhypusine synthase
MVFAEATLALPLIAGYAWHKGNWKNRQAREYTKLLDERAIHSKAAKAKDLAPA